MFDMFGFKRKTGPREVPSELTEIRDCLTENVGTAIGLYASTLVGYLAMPGSGQTKDDVERARKKMVSHLRKYVQGEILLERALSGGKVFPEDLAKFRIG